MAFYRASPSPSPYDLRSIIQLYPEQEPWCIGFAVTRGRRCHNQTSAVSREKACSLLDRGTWDLAQGLDISDLLGQLAPLVLCKRWHQYECHDLVNRWARKVEDFQMRQSQASLIWTTPTRTISPSWSSPSTLGYPYTLGYSETNHYRRYGSPDEICSAQRITDLLQNMSDRLDRVVESLEDSGQPSAVRQRDNGTRTRSTAGRPAQRQASSLAAGAATSRSASRTVEPNDSSVRNRGSTSTSTRTERTLERTRNSSGTIPSSSTAARQTPSTTSVSEPDNVAPTRPTRVRVSLARVPEVNINRITSATRRTVTRKPIEGDCSICTNPLIHEDHSTETSPGTENEGQLSWCRAQCGNNYHKECIGQWLSTCRDMFRTPTCPYCRARWVE
ncbi:hypothetical protein DTO271G3_6764 [Paecilomyces variotii]|nr:hypothetical protein DTO271G3_6764 [Paecilomyces variotii]